MREDPQGSVEYVCVYIALSDLSGKFIRIRPQQKRDLSQTKKQKEDNLITSSDRDATDDGSLALQLKKPIQVKMTVTSGANRLG
ncbi:hypothetical protein V5799_029611 [Amblyomma americanum]|uniref:Uncharacterized protein n=1 Tax=Amblyomma americanum TaxID=6943 RepID=A0AAQ4EQT6_AMBAM